MKKIFLLLMAVGLVAPIARAQDAATEERLNKLAGQIEDLQSARVDLDKKLSEATKEIEELRRAQGRVNTNYAAQADLNRLSGQLKEIDQKRIDDNEKILKEIEKLAATTKKTSTPSSTQTGDTTSRPANEKGYEYVIKPNDTLSAIVAAYREEKIKVTVDSILKANPGLKANNLTVGKKIFIPAPPQ